MRDCSFAAAVMPPNMPPSCMLARCSAAFRRAVQRLISSSITALIGVPSSRQHLSRNSVVITTPRTPAHGQRSPRLPVRASALTRTQPLKRTKPAMRAFHSADYATLTRPTRSIWLTQAKLRKPIYQLRKGTLISKFVLSVEPAHHMARISTQKLRQGKRTVR